MQNRLSDGAAFARVDQSDANPLADPVNYLKVRTLEWTSGRQHATIKASPFA